MTKNATAPVTSTGPRSHIGPFRLRCCRTLDRFIETGRLLAGRFRAALLAARGAQVGRKVWIGPRCTFERPWCLSLDDRVRVEEAVYVKVTDDSAGVSIGAYSFIGRGTELDVAREVRIGDHALLAPRCFVTDHGHEFRQASRRMDELGIVTAPVRIGNDTWLGTGAVVLMGTTIGDGAVIGAGSVVRADVPAQEIHAGVPARCIGKRG